MKNETKKTNEIRLSSLTKTKKIFIEHGGAHHYDTPFVYDCVMISYVAHGCGVYNITNSPLPISEGDIFITNPDIVHHFIPNQDLTRIETYNCLFQPEALGDFWNQLKEFYPSLQGFFDNTSIKYLQAVDTENHEIRDLFIRIIDEYMNKPIGYFEICRSYLQILLLKILRNLKTRNFKRVFSNNPIVDECIRMIHQQLYAGISLKELAQKMHKSPQYICRLFKKNTGMTTSQFINFLRLEKAKDILRNTDKPIIHIPELLGCGSEYIRRLFKEDTGMSMKEYRAAHHYK